MSVRVRGIAIERFRAFRGLRIEGLGRVNLITGDEQYGEVFCSGSTPHPSFRRFAIGRQQYPSLP